MDVNTVLHKDLVKSESQFTFELEGKSEIDVRTLTQILNSTVGIIEELVAGEPDAYVNLKVTKFSTGSFDIDFHAIAEQVASIMTAPEILASTLAGGVLGVFRIAKHLKGEKPKEIIDSKGGNKEIINADGGSIIVAKKTADSFFCNNKIEGEIIHIVNIISQETDRTGFRLTGPNLSAKHEEELVEINKEEFDFIKPVVSDMIQESERTVFTNTVQATLIIRKPDLTGDSKWGFIFDKNIDAAIEDKEWINKIRERKFRFGPGMKLPVVLKIEVDLDSCQQSIRGSERYTVMQVTGEVIEPETVDYQTKIEHSTL